MPRPFPAPADPDPERATPLARLVDGPTLAHRLGLVVRAPEAVRQARALARARRHAVTEREDAANVARGAYLVADLLERAAATSALGSGAAGETMDAAVRHASVRGFVHALPAHLPEVPHLRAVVEGFTPSPTARPLPLDGALAPYLDFLEQDGRLGEARDLLAAAVESHTDPISITAIAAVAFRAGRLHLRLAHWEAARAGYRMAEEAAGAVGDVVIRYRARLGQGAFARAHRAWTEAWRLAEAVRLDAHAARLPEVEAMACQGVAAAWAQQGRYRLSLAANERAYALTQDLEQQLRILTDLGAVHTRLGQHRAARRALETVAERATDALLRVSAQIELMYLAAVTRDRPAFESYRGMVEHGGLSLPPSLMADYFAKNSVGLDQFGQRAEAAAAHATALETATPQGSLRPQDDPGTWRGTWGA